MPDTKVSLLTEKLTPEDADLVHLVDIAGGTLSKKATIANLLAGAVPEGTAVLSTGEAGGTKFLREDGDGTCSWQAPAGGGDALTANPLSQFAATTSLQLLGVMSDETGTGSLVFSTSPILVTPALGTPSSGVATNLTGTAAGLTAGNVTTNANLTGHITSVGNASLLGSFTTAQLNAAISDGSINTPEGTAVLSTGEGGGSKFLREDGDGTCSWVAIPGGGDALVANPLSQFAATTSLQLAGVISDETGTGSLVFSTSPVFITPALGTPASGVATNLTGTAAGLTAGNVTTNADLTGHITSTGNAAILGSFTVAQLSAALSDASISGNNTGDDPGLENLLEDVTPQLGANLDYNGFGHVRELTAAVNLSAGDLCYMNSSTKMAKTDADAEGTTKGMLAISLDSPVADAVGTFLLYGPYTTTGLTAGAVYFVGVNEGFYQNAAPSVAGQQVRPIGHAHSTTVLFFDPSPSWGEI